MDEYRRTYQQKFMQDGYFVTLKNALEIKKYLDKGLKKAKIDKKDTYKLAEYAYVNWYKLHL